MDTTTSFTVLIAAFLTTTAMDALKRLSKWVSKQSPTVKRLIVLGLSAGSIALSRILGGTVLPLDPTLWSADTVQRMLVSLITALLAFGAHSLKPLIWKQAVKAPDPTI